MSLNKFMHPRNKYKIPPNFTDLAIDYPEFRLISKLGINGKVTIDFKDEKTLRILTKCLLQRDFKLDVMLPENKLVPTLPLRLNYILWIEDILKSVEIETSNVTGIDIGCGASCIYGLLAAKEYEWKMIALDTNNDSCNYARQNVQRNELDSLIKVIHQDDPTKIFNKLCDTLTHQAADFCMCNPPFFSTLDDLNANAHSKKNRTGHRPSPHNGRTGNNGELVVEGGECEFVQRIIEESCQLKDRIKIYTTMLGHKSSVDKIVKFLLSREITNFTQTEFCQGYTTRWGIAWTFCLDIFLRIVPMHGQNVVKNKIFTHHITTTDVDISSFFRLVEKHLLSVNVIVKNIIFTDSNNVRCNAVAAVDNTWSKQRQKRRECERKEKPHLENEINAKKEVSQVNAASNKISAKSFEDQQPLAKKRKLDELTVPEKDKEFPFLVFRCSMEKIESTTHLYLEYLYGKGGKDGVYQILQFLINRLK